MTALRRSYRLLLLTLLVLFGIAATLVLAPRDAGRPRTARHRAVIRAWHALVCRVLGLRVQVYGEPLAGPALLVANHISWLDIPVIGSATDAAFLSKAEVRRWPVIGWLAERSGTLFIRRGGKDAANAAAEVMTFQLLRGGSVLIFPEGTTTTGERMRRFHPRLFAAAQRAERPVQPVALRYLRAPGEPNVAPFVGDDTFPAHLWRVLGAAPFQVEVIFCPPIASQGVDRRRLAEEAQLRIATVLAGEPQAMDRGMGA